MKRIILCLLLFAPLSATAGHMDVIKFQLNEGCSLPEFIQITQDFNAWGADFGYHARVASPIQNDDLTSYYWLGETDNAAVFGGAWDTWRDALSDLDSVPAQLWARFQDCSTNISRTGYDIFP